MSSAEVEIQNYENSSIIESEVRMISIHQMSKVSSVPSKMIEA